MAITLPYEYYELLYLIDNKYVYIYDTVSNLNEGPRIKVNTYDSAVYFALKNGIISYYMYNIYNHGNCSISYDYEKCFIMNFVPWIKKNNSWDFYNFISIMIKNKKYLIANICGIDIYLITYDNINAYFMLNDILSVSTNDVSNFRMSVIFTSVIDNIHMLKTYNYLNSLFFIPINKKLNNNFIEYNLAATYSELSKVCKYDYHCWLIKLNKIEMQKLFNTYTNQLYENSSILNISFDITDKYILKNNTNRINTNNEYNFNYLAYIYQ